MKQLLKQAQSRLRKYGWIQHSRGDKSQGYCAWGAILGDTNGVTQKQSNAEILLETFLDGESLVGWNDSKGRTKRQVIGLFQRAINKLSK